MLLDPKSSLPNGMDVYFVDPFEIHLSRLQEGTAQSRSADVAEMAMSLHTSGQRRAVECHRTPTGRTVLVHGVIRTAAARLLRTGFPNTGSGPLLIKDRKFKLKVVFYSASPCPTASGLPSTDSEPMQFEQNS